MTSAMTPQDATQKVVASEQAAWPLDLQGLGYNDPLPIPSPCIQATLAALKGPAIHEFVQAQDHAALLDCDDEGEPAPLLLRTLDLSQWTRILSLVAVANADKALEQLQLAHSLLADILDREAEEQLQAEKDSLAVDSVLKRANPHEGTQESTSLSSSSSRNPFLCGLNIEPSEQAALEDLELSIQTSQTEKDLAALVSSGKGPVVPFTPSRTVEYLVAAKGHRCWGLPNINLMAPISIPMWRTWIDIPPTEIDVLKAHVLYNTGHLREPQSIPGAFPLSMFDHHKCTSLDVKVHTKQDLQTGFGRVEKYSSAIWNCRRPYLRCMCRQDTSHGCRGDVMWFDHAIYYMLNHLGEFFQDDHPTLAAKFGAFIVWLMKAGKVAIRHQIIFAHLRSLMMEASLEYANDPTAKLLSAHPDAPGIRKIERWIKPASFSLANPAPPGNNLSSKKQRTTINCNVSAEDLAFRTPPPQKGAPRVSSRGGRGGYNRRYRTGPQSAPAAQRPRHQQPVQARTVTPPSNANDAFVFIGHTPPANRSGGQNYSLEASHAHSRVPSRSYSQPPPLAQSPTASHNEATSARSAPRFVRGAMTGKILEWDE